MSTPAPVRAPRAPSFDGESRRLKIAGLIALACSVPPLVWVGERVATREWLAAAGANDLAVAATTWFGGALLLALGLILLLAGLQGVRVLTSPRARSGVWMKMAGAALIILCFAFANLVDPGTRAFAWMESWVMAPALVVFVIAARGGIILLRTGWKYEALSAEQLLAEDPRPPVVYLRSFIDDDRILLPPAGRTGSWLRRLYPFLPPFYLAAFSPEQELATIMSRVGPVVAIGRPGEALPELGAARMYVDDDTWKERIAALMNRAGAVIIQAGTTSNLWWEVEQAMTLVPRRQVILVCFDAGVQGGFFDGRFAERFGAPARLPGKAPTMPVRWLRWPMRVNRTTGRVIFFDADGGPRELPIQLTMSWTGVMVGIARPYRDTLEAAMKRVFAELALPWTEQKTQTMAVMLALFGGMLGLHHFYVGNRRRGVRYAATVWLGVPFVLGWIDAVRFALLSREEFERVYLQPVR